MNQLREPGVDGAPLLFQAVNIDECFKAVTKASPLGKPTVRVERAGHGITTGFGRSFEKRKRYTTPPLFFLPKFRLIPYFLLAFSGMYPGRGTDVAQQVNRSPIFYCGFSFPPPPPDTPTILSP